jgi:ribosome recycling factor
MPKFVALYRGTRDVLENSNRVLDEYEIIVEKEPEDEEKSAMDEVQELINKYNKVVDDKFKEKENELMTV